MLFSIIICTYNPSPNLLEKVLHSCCDQTLDPDLYEIVVVDNNSKVALTKQNFFSKFFLHKNFKYLLETRQGLAFGRICGIKTSQAPIVIFVDDDNILDAHYLQNLTALLDSNTSVGVFGPGVITLDYPEGAPTWIRKHFGHMYQKKNLGQQKFGAEIEWQDYYPAGSGLVVRKIILDKYIRDFESGAITATGRNANSLASAEDSQIIWTGIKMGYLAGTSPTLKLQHVIPGKRTTLKYLTALNYGISFSYYNALKEMFPDYELPHSRRTIINKMTFILKTFIKAKGNPVLFSRLHAINNAWLKGFDDYIFLKNKIK